MADVTGSGILCNDLCGCPSPCPGGLACRCRTGAGGDDVSGEHKKCSCGEHCGCNPCTCAKSSGASGTGKMFCRCGDGCTCVTCAS